MLRLEMRCASTSILHDALNRKARNFMPQFYMAGHGGEDFMKFQDQTELTAGEIADAFATMQTAGRYRCGMT